MYETLKCSATIRLDTTHWLNLQVAALWVHSNDLSLIYTVGHTLHSTSLHYPTDPNVLTVLFVRGHCHSFTHQSSCCGFSCYPVVKLFESPLYWCRHHKHTWGQQTMKVPEKSQSIKNSPALTLTPSGSTAEAWRWVIMTAVMLLWLAYKHVLFYLSCSLSQMENLTGIGQQNVLQTYKSNTFCLLFLLLFLVSFIFSVSTTMSFPFLPSFRQYFTVCHQHRFVQ